MQLPAGPPPEATTMPSYEALVRRSYGSLSGALRGCPGCGWELARRTWAENAWLSWSEALLALLGALGWTLARHAAARSLLRPFAEWCRLPPQDAAKMPESAWKLAFYTTSWLYVTYLLFFCGFPFFYDPPSVFYDWKTGMEMPTGIAVFYLMQASFYGHAIYATIYMDAWRKDSVVMILHHMVALILIVFSYMCRYHNIGILVFFLHDINDIFLEFSKLNVYFKYRGGVYHCLNDVVASIGCVGFCVSWFWFRLYWFPLKVLYTTCHTSLQTIPEMPFYFLFNALLLVVLLMNIYWFLYIIFFVSKVLMGQVRELNDVREYDVSLTSKAKERERHLHSSLKERDHLKNGLVKDKRL